MRMAGFVFQCRFQKMYENIRRKINLKKLLRNYNLKCLLFFFFYDIMYHVVIYFLKYKLVRMLRNSLFMCI